MKSSAGNALFLILIAVALFAALSYALTQSGRSGGSADREQASIIAAELFQTSAALQSTLTRIKILNGCSDTQLNFENNVSFSSYVNPTSPADGRCDVFNNSTGASFPANPENIGSEKGWLITGAHCIRGIGQTNDCDAVEKELLLSYMHVSKETCVEINRKAGVGAPGANPPGDNFGGGLGSSIHTFRGEYGTSTGSTAILEGTDFNGKTAGCIQDTIGSSAGQYIFYYVLSAR